MKNTYQKIIKEIIGPGAKEHGFTYSCSGAMIMTKPLAMYTRKGDGYNQMIYIYQNLIDPKEIKFCYKGLETSVSYICKSDEDFRNAVLDMEKQLQEGGYDELDELLNSPFRLKREQKEYFRDNFEALWKKFEANHDMGDTKDIKNALILLDEYYKEANLISGEDLLDYLFQIAAEYGKVILELPNSYTEWNEEYGKFFVNRSDSTVAKRRNDVLFLVFKSYEIKAMPKFAAKYKGLLSLDEKKRLL
ncbi:hypothetical protein [Butyrivibrio proteoclasticus]|uniref:hypothetical protein n=1 Tax=Butyrivibrio proteoclasticus TaxID=43305 RepID=UPI00047D592D|nr:hypothetical protein [Butyrivibrio proteoclasticus]